MRYLSLLLGFLYLGFLALLPQVEASSSATVRYDDDAYCFQGDIWEGGYNTYRPCDDDRHEDDDDDDDNDDWDNDDDDHEWDNDDFDWQRRHGRTQNYYPLSRPVDDRRYDTVVRRYNIPESRLVYSSPLEQFFISSPFRAARAQLHPYFRNSPLQGYAPVFGMSPAFQSYVNDQQARRSLGFDSRPVSPSAVCRNYTVFRYSPRSPALLESCN